MAAIVNPNPITLAVADKYWVIGCILLPDIIIATLAPWDGQYVVGNQSTHRRLQIHNMAAVCGPVFAKVATMGSITNIKCVNVHAADSLDSATATATYDTGETRVVDEQTVPIMGLYSIPDLFAAVALDVELAQAYGTVMAAIEGAI
jgi:hypothetical protein